jgi:hypothetical protein
VCKYPHRINSKTINLWDKKLRLLATTPLITGVGEDAGKKEPFYTAGGNVN